MIELDEFEGDPEFVRCTCLDRGRIALLQSGQVHCAMILGKLQLAIDDVAECYGFNANKPVEVVRWLMSKVSGETDSEEIWRAEAER